METIDLHPALTLTDQHFFFEENANSCFELPLPFYY